MENLRYKCYVKISVGDKLMIRDDVCVIKEEVILYRECDDKDFFFSKVK